MQLRDDRIEQSASPTTMARALRREVYQTRSHQPIKSICSRVHTPKSLPGLPVCPKCHGELDADCDCNAGFKVEFDEAAMPTRFNPGSAERVAIYNARSQHGLPMRVPGDKCNFDERVVGVWG